MDLRVGGHIRVQEVSRVDFDETNVIFPLKDMYDRANGTLEGLSAPYGSIRDVAPQGLSDLGINNQEERVGAPAGEAESKDNDDDEDIVEALAAEAESAIPAEDVETDA